MKTVSASSAHFDGEHVRSGDPLELRPVPNIVTEPEAALELGLKALDATCA